MRNQLTRAAELLKKKRRHKIWMKTVGVLACVVVFCTTYALILPALTLAKPTCGLEEHVHSKDCYEEVPTGEKTLTCSTETLGIHTHTDDCYDSDGNLICGYADFVLHTHDESCYDEDGNLICTLPEINAETIAEALDVSVEDMSEQTEFDDAEIVVLREDEDSDEQEIDASDDETDASTQTIEIDVGEAGATEESAAIEPHTHTKDCYDSDGNLICGKLEVEEHVHTEDCFTEETERKLICGKEEHTHTDACYEDDTAADAAEGSAEIIAPAQDFTGSANGVAVTVSAPEGAFPADTKMSVSKAKADAVQAAADAVDADTADVKAVDITFTANGKEIEPAVPINVTLQSDLVADSADALVVHVDDNAKAEIIPKTTVKDETVSFEADAFSVYAIVGTDVTDPRYTVEFYTGNGMDGDPYETQIVKAGDSLVRPETPEILEGYNEFVGWYLGGTAGTDGVWTGGTEVQFGPVAEDWLKDNATDGVIRIHARFINAIHVTFYDHLPEADEVDPSMSQPNIVTIRSMTGGPIDLNSITAESSVAGMVFDKWVDEDGKAVSTPYTATEDTGLYATFVKGYSLVFDANGDGASSTATQHLKTGELTRTPATPARPGYTFQGWYTASTGGTQFIFGGELTADTTVYAHWTAATANYTVVYWYENADDDGYSYAGSTTGSTNTGSTISSDSFRNTDFTGRDSTHFTYNSEKAESQVVEGDGSTVLNVYFTRNTYTLTFQSQNNGGGPGGNNRTTYGTITAKYQAYIGDQWPTAGTTMTGSNTRVPNNLTGWTVTLVGASSSTTQATKVYTMTEQYCSNNGLTLTANTSYNANTYTANYMMESLDGTGTPYNGKYYQNDSRYTQSMYTTITTLSPKQIDGFTAVSSTAVNVQNNAFTLYYNRNRNNITFNDNYGNTTATISDVMFEMPLSNVTYDGKAISEIVPTYPNEALTEHYTFKGWYTTEGCYDGTEADFTNGTMPNANLIFYAKWEAEKINVTYDANGGTFTDAQGTKSDTVEVTVDYGDKLANVPTPYNEGYTFLGWVDKDGNAWNFDTAVTEDTTLYAQWHTDRVLNIIYQIPQDGGEIDVTTVSDPNHYDDGATAIVKPYGTEGARFVGWSLGEFTGDYNSIYQPGDEIEVSSTTDRDDGKADYTVTLYAVFADEIKTSITFDANGGTFDNDDTKAIKELKNNEGVDLDIITNPTKDGYNFLGWATESNATEPKFKADGTDKEEIAADNINEETENILYAVWEKAPNLIVKKVDTADTSVALSGAEFVLYYTDNDVEYYYKNGSWTQISENVSEDDYALTTEDGTITFSSLPSGTYHLKEIKAPDGYKLLENEIILTVGNGQITADTGDKVAQDTENADTYILTVSNSTGTELPHTGGSGTIMFTFGGLAILAGCLMAGYSMRRKREGGSN